MACENGSPLLNPFMFTGDGWEPEMVWFPPLFCCLFGSTLKMPTDRFNPWGHHATRPESPHNRRADAAMQYTLFPEPDRSSTVPVLAWFIP